MELYEVITLDPAEIDIRNIISYITYEFDAPVTAERIKNDFKKAVLRLSESPELYPRILELEEYRKIPIKNYLIFYTVDKLNKVVYVERVLHSSQNWLDILQSEESPCLTIL
jgi:addiction module RelE/StbE family toxin